MQGSEKFIIRMFFESQEEIKKLVRLEFEKDLTNSGKGKLLIWKSINKKLKDYLIEASADRKKEIVSVSNKHFNINFPDIRKKKKKKKKS